MIYEKQVTMVINQFNKDYYGSLFHQQYKGGERILVPVDLLPATSGVKVTTQCEYCHRDFIVSYRRYLLSQEKGKICCTHCKGQKITENCIEKYNTRCTLQVPQFKQKMINNNLLKYGTTHSVTKESYAKRGKTMLQKYGAEYTLQSSELRSRVNQTMFELGNCATYTSKQQKYLSELINGEINYPFGPYHIDVYSASLGIGIEYSGSGHDLGVRLGNVSKDEFLLREENRREYFIKHGFPVLEFVSKTDKLPPDIILLDLIQIFINSHELYSQINLDELSF